MTRSPPTTDINHVITNLEFNQGWVGLLKGFCPALYRTQRTTLIQTHTNCVKTQIHSHCSPNVRNRGGTLTWSHAHNAWKTHPPTSLNPDETSTNRTLSRRQIMNIYNPVCMLPVAITVFWRRLWAETGTGCCCIIIFQLKIAWPCIPAKTGLLKLPNLRTATDSINSWIPWSQSRKYQIERTSSSPTHCVQLVVSNHISIIIINSWNHIILIVHQLLFILNHTYPEQQRTCMKIECKVILDIKPHAHPHQ